MKTHLIIICLFLLISCLSFSCQKIDNNEPVLWELPNDGSKTAITETMDSIEYKFYLLNEAGTPATTFSKGENFSFLFSVTNKSGQKLLFDPEFAYSKDITLCNVYKSTGEDLGKPFILLTSIDIGPGAYPFANGKSYIFQSRWNNKLDSLWTWEQGNYKSVSTPILEKGNYYTEFKYQFHFPSAEQSGSMVKTDAINFKINFKIQ